MIPGLTDRNPDAAAIRRILKEHPGIWCAAKHPNVMRALNPLMTVCCLPSHGTGTLHENALGETFGVVLRAIDRVPEAVKPW
jgi:hypothetical protein